MNVGMWIPVGQGIFVSTRNRIARSNGSSIFNFLFFGSNVTCDSLCFISKYFVSNHQPRGDGGVEINGRDWNSCPE